MGRHDARPTRGRALEKPLYKCMTKATTAEGEDLRHSFNWMMARRGFLKVMPDALVCGDWRILYEEIDEAVLFHVKAILLPGFVLRVRTKGKTYQFGLNWGSFWKKELPFPVARETAKLTYSRFSIAIRLILLAYIIYFMWEHFIA